MDEEIRGIGWAIKQMQNGSSVTRHGWNGPGQHLQLQVPDSMSKMTSPYVYLRTAQGNLVPWLPSQTDLLATDWEIVGVDGPTGGAPSQGHEGN